jgi:hypothetical protein
MILGVFTVLLWAYIIYKASKMDGRLVVVFLGILSPIIIGSIFIEIFRFRNNKDIKQKIVSYIEKNFTNPKLKEEVFKKFEKYKSKEYLEKIIYRTIENIKDRIIFKDKTFKMFLSGI